MSTTRKVLTIIFSILIVGAFAFVLTWGIINWSKVKEGMAGNGLYTQDDVQKSYEDGYSTALKDKEEYEKLITGYRDTITTQNDLISQHTSEVNSLNSSIKDYQAQITTLTEQKTEIEAQVETLNTIKTSNEATITELNGQIADLSAQIVTLQAGGAENQAQIAQLTSQVNNLQSLNEQLQANNELNVKTINGLNAQITSLNNQIADLTLQTQNNSAVVSSLNAKIAELQKSVSYYEQYLGTLESGEQVVATFEYDGSVYNVQVVNKNSLLSVTTPESTAYKIFNGWTVNGEPIDLSTYRITANTKIIADVTYKYEVNFVVEDENYHNVLVLKDSVAPVPSAPTKAGYEFDGWTLDGNSVVDMSRYTITQNTTFTAKFTKLYSVIFKYEDTTLANNTVRSGSRATAPQTVSTAYKVFNGWKVGGTMVNLDEYRISSDTVFVADITYKYDVKFMADGKVHNSQIVEKHGKPTVPSNPTKSNYVFVGWSVDGTNTVDVSKYMIVGNTTFTAIFRVDKFTVTFKNGSTTISTQEVTNGGYATRPNFDTETFKGWTVNGTDIVNISTYKITANTTFTAKFGTWTLLQNEAYHAYSDGYSGNSTTVLISGLKAGDKVKISINFMQANITDTGSNSYWYNSPDGNGCYGWQFDGNAWYAMDEYGNITGNPSYGGTADMTSITPFTSTLGVVDYGTDNTFTITISCKKDGVLTIEWNDAAGFYLEQMTFWDVMVLR